MDGTLREARVTMSVSATCRIGIPLSAVSPQIADVEISYLIALDELENSSILFKFQKSVREVCCAGCSSNPKTTSVFKTALTPAPPRTPPAQLRSSLLQGEDVPSKWETPDPAAFRAALADALAAGCGGDVRILKVPAPAAWRFKCW